MKPAEITLLALLRAGHTGTVKGLSRQTGLSNNVTQRALWYLEEEGHVTRIDIEDRPGNGIHGNVWACTGPSGLITVKAPDVEPGLPIVQSALLSRLPLDLWAARL